MRRPRDGGALPSMRWRPTLAVTAALALVVGGIALTTSADAGTSVCDKYGQARTASGYVAQNNLWGTDTPQCITVSGDGFTLSTSRANKPTNGPPASYPSVFWGCRYATCTSGFTPIQASSAAFSKIATSVQFGYVDQGAYDAAYDIWFDPTPRTDGQNTGAELMIWLNHRGSVQPIGNKVGTANIAGADWDVWFGNIGWNVVSYVRTTAATTLSSPVSSFYGDVVKRGYGQTSWYLTSVQAGFEPWVGGAGLAVDSFAVTTDGTQPTQSPTPTPTPTGNPTTGAAACTATAAITGSWGGGFQAAVTVKNTGSATLSHWSVRWAFPGGQSINNLWNGVTSSSGSAVTVANAPYNGL